MKQGAGHGKSRETWGGPEPEHLVKHPKAFHRASLHMQSGSHTSTDSPAQPPSSLPGARPSLWGQGTARAGRPPDGHRAPRAGPGRGALGGEATSLFDQIRTCLRDGHRCHRCHRCHRYWATKCRVRSLGGGTACSLSSPPSSGPCGQASRQADEAPARTSLGRRGQETGPPEAGVPRPTSVGVELAEPCRVAGPQQPGGGRAGQPPHSALRGRQDVDTEGSSRLIYYLIKGSRLHWWTASGCAGAWGGRRWAGGLSRLRAGLRAGCRTEGCGLFRPWPTAFVLQAPLSLWSGPPPGCLSPEPAPLTPHNPHCSPPLQVPFPPSLCRSPAPSPPGRSSELRAAGPGLSLPKRSDPGAAPAPAQPRPPRGLGRPVPHTRVHSRHRRRWPASRRLPLRACAHAAPRAATPFIACA